MSWNCSLTTFDAGKALDTWLSSGHSKGKVELLAFQECNFGSNLQDQYVVNLII